MTPDDVLARHRLCNPDDSEGPHKHCICAHAPDAWPCEAVQMAERAKAAEADAEALRAVLRRFNLPDHDDYEDSVRAIVGYDMRAKRQSARVVASGPSGSACGMAAGPSHKEVLMSEPFIVLNDERNEDQPVIDGQFYRVGIRKMGMNCQFYGWFSALRSTKGRLFFYGELGGEWFMLPARLIFFIEPAEHGARGAA